MILEEGWSKTLKKINFGCNIQRKIQKKKKDETMFNNEYIMKKK